MIYRENDVRDNIFRMAGFFGVILFIMSVSIFSAKHAASGRSFAFNERKAGIPTTIGLMLGTLVSGQATLGSAQLAFHYGFSAWWFTLGSGIGCLLLGLVYASRMRASRSLTIVSIIRDRFGGKCAGLASVLSVIGIFISVVSQVLSEIALLSVMFHVSFRTAGVLTIILMAGYISFGGAVGSGYAGLAKVMLLIFSCSLGVIYILSVSGGAVSFCDQFVGLHLHSPLSEVLGTFSEGDVRLKYFQLFARGLSKDGASAVSMIVGVISTQSYATAVWSAKSDKTARQALLMSAVIVPLIGAACILIGLFMRTQCVTAEEAEYLRSINAAIPEGLVRIESSSQIFPYFWEHYLPPLFGGVCLGTLLIALAGGGAGLAFGVSTVLIDDIGSFVFAGREMGLPVRRAVIIAVLAAAYGAACLFSGSMINDIGFLSMGLRGTVIFIPLSAALSGRIRVSEKGIIAAMLTGLLTLIISRMLFPDRDLLPCAILAEAVMILIAAGVSKKREFNHE